MLYYTCIYIYISFYFIFTYIYIYIYIRSDMQFMSNYTSAAAFRQPNGETKWKKRNREQENLWLQGKLITSTYNTGPDGFVQGGPQNQRNDGETIITKEKYIEGDPSRDAQQGSWPLVSRFGG